MELLVLKIAAVAGCGLALFYVARAFSGNSSSHISPTSRPTDQQDPNLPNSGRTPLPRVGREIPFPLNISELEAQLEEKYGPGYFRPKILNYYFRNTDLETGPMEPTDFCDQFFIEFENPDDGYSWVMSAMITTPKGLGRMMEEERRDAVWEKNMLVIKRFDLRLILRSFLEDLAEWHTVSTTELEPQQDSFDRDIG